MVYRLYGIRHHGPGSARALRDALEVFDPDCVLLEGPPDAESALAVLSDPALKPPVALLIHDIEDPRRAVFYPFVVFSPEWQALRYATDHGLSAHFVDLPVSISIELESQRSEPSARTLDPLRDDPLRLLAEAAGFEDDEQWWDVQVEQRRDATGLFEGIQEAMTALRADHMPSSARDER